jgi:predicted nucleic acid-binding protein
LTVFVDTSALYAVLDDTDPHHAHVAVELRASEDRRLGAVPTRRLLDNVLPLVDVIWVDESIHTAAVKAFLGRGANRPSLVDFTSFEVMRAHGIRVALAVDRDFAEAGFEVLPA